MSSVVPAVPVLLDAKQLASVLHIRSSTLLKLQKQGVVPKPIRLAGRRLWVSEEIGDVIRKLSAEASNGASN